MIDYRSPRAGFALFVVAVLAVGCVGIPVASSSPTLTLPITTPAVTLPVVPTPTLPGIPTTAPTLPPTDPPTNPPTDPPTDPPTNPPTDPPTDPPTNPPTAPPTAIPGGTIDSTLESNYGFVNLSSGFQPDPYEKTPVTSGGRVDVSYLGGGCRGYTTSPADFFVAFTSGTAFPTLRFYFIGDLDTTMVVSSPTGTITCADDTYDTINPTVDVPQETGRYDIWIGSYRIGEPTTGTLYVTERDSQHP